MVINKSLKLQLIILGIIWILTMILFGVFISPNILIWAIVGSVNIPGLYSIILLFFVLILMEILPKEVIKYIPSIIFVIFFSLFLSALLLKSELAGIIIVYSALLIPMGILILITGGWKIIFLPIIIIILIILFIFLLKLLKNKFDKDKVL